MDVTGFKEEVTVRLVEDQGGWRVVLCGGRLQKTSEYPTSRQRRERRAALVCASFPQSTVILSVTDKSFGLGFRRTE
jgi:hypothetical protein